MSAAPGTYWPTPRLDLVDWDYLLQRIAFAAVSASIGWWGHRAKWEKRRILLAIGVFALTCLAFYRAYQHFFPG